MVMPSFGPSMATRSMPWSEIVGSRQEAPYYSPKAEMFSTNVADLALLSDLASLGDMNRAADTWVGDVAAVEHRLLIRKRPEENLGKEGVWFHALYHWPMSAVLVWPGRLAVLGNAAVFTHDASCSETTLLSMWDVLAWEACTFVWRSPLWQSKNLEADVLNPRRAVPVIEHGPTTIAR